MDKINGIIIDGEVYEAKEIDKPTYFANATIRATTDAIRVRQDTRYVLRESRVDSRIKRRFSSAHSLLN